jgi:serine protease
MVRRSIAVAATAALATLALLSASAYSADASVRVLVGFKGSSGAEARQLIRSVGGKILYDYDLIPAIAADVPAQEAKELEKNAAVSYVEEEQHRTPTGHIIPGQLWTGTPEILPWGVDRIDADEVWDPDGNLVVNGGTSAGQGVEVAVLDTGLDTTPEHPDLAANLNLADSFDFLGNDADVSDIPGVVTGHGTATSGIVGAVDNSIGVIGVAPLADIVMYRVCDSALNACPDSAIIAALEEAAEDGADVVSMSFGGIGFSQAEKQAIKAASDAGLVLVASAGNTPTKVAGARSYPAAFPEVISVGATDVNDDLASFSTFGGHQELVAPGVETPTTTLIGFGREATLEENSPTSQDLDPNPMVFSATGSITADLVNAGFGTVADFAATDCTTGGAKIALVSRGSIPFAEKVANAAADGCIGAVIYNNVAGNFLGTLGSPSAIPAVSISQAEGQALVAELGGGPVNATLDVLASDYDSFSGTSASAPHVAGVAALVLSADSSLSNDEVREILDDTAENLGNPSFDIRFGWGIVDAEAAVACAEGGGC